MDEQVQQLVDRVLRLHQNAPEDRRIMVAVSGIPGSGKTTIASKVVDAINAKAASANGNARAMLLSLDGYHLIRADLDKMADPELAHARRGAAFTFNPAGFLQTVRKLREPIDAETKTITSPSFDHATKDPVPDDVKIPPTCRIIILEGNYLSLGTGAPEWREAAAMMDDQWFVDVPEDVARERLVKRHLAADIARTEEEALKRAEENDLVNGREILAGRLKVDVVVQGA